MSLKIAIIGTAGLPATYGGFETLAEYLTKYLSKNFQITIYCSGNKSYSNLKEYNGARLEYIPLNANGIQSIPYDIISTCKALRYANVLLILGVSGGLFLPFVRLISKTKIIINIDGLEWKRAKWGKLAKTFLKFSEKIAVKSAHVVIADNKVIQNHVRDSYGKQSELIAYGGDHVKRLPLTRDLKQEFKFLEKPYAFNVCRIEPENNVHIILQAFAKCPNLTLMIVGNWNNSSYGIQLREQFGFFLNIHLLDSIYNQDKLDRLRSNCYLYVHGHSAGGTNPSLVEAMFLELPIIAFDINYNKATTNNKAIYFKNEEQLLHHLNNLSSLNLMMVKKDMKDFAKRNYPWAYISNQYRVLFTI